MESPNAKVRHILAYVFSAIYIAMGLLMLLTSPGDPDLQLVGAGMAGIGALLAESTHFIRKQQSSQKAVPDTTTLDRKMSRQISRDLEADGEIRLSPEDMDEIMSGTPGRKDTSPEASLSPEELQDILGGNTDIQDSLPH